MALLAYFPGEPSPGRTPRGTHRPKRLAQFSPHTMQQRNQGGRSQLLRYFRNPMGKQPMRLPTYPGLDRTAVLSYQAPLTLTVPTTGTLSIGFQPQTLLPLWASVPVTHETWQVVYLAAATILNTAAKVTIPFERLQSLTAGATGSLSTAFAPATLGAVPPPAQAPIIGQDGSPIPFTYVPAGFNLYVGVALGTTATEQVEAAVEFEQWADPGDTSLPGSTPTLSTMVLTVQSGKGSGFNGAYTFAANSWIRPVTVIVNAGYPNIGVDLFVTAGTVAFEASASTWGTATVTARTAFSAYLPVICPNDFFSSPQPWADTRVVAGELQMVNVTPQLSRGGSVLAARLTPESAPSFNWNAATLSTVNPREKAFFPADKMITAHLPPNTTTPTFVDGTYDVAAASTYIDGKGSIKACPMYSLKALGPFAAMFITAPSTSTFAVTLEWHIEFRTPSSLFPIGHSVATIQDMHAAAKQLAGTHPFSISDGKGLYRTDAQQERRRRQRRQPQPTQPKEQKKKPEATQPKQAGKTKTPSPVKP